MEPKMKPKVLKLAMEITDLDEDFVSELQEFKEPQPNYPESDLRLSLSDGVSWLNMTAKKPIYILPELIRFLRAVQEKGKLQFSVENKSDIDL